MLVKEVVKVVISFDESFIGCHRTVSFVNINKEECEIEVDIPPNAYNGQRIELEEYIIIIAIQPHPRKWRCDIQKVEEKKEEGVVYFSIKDDTTVFSSSGYGLLVPFGEIINDISYKINNSLLQMESQSTLVVTIKSKPQSMNEEEEKQLKKIDDEIEENRKKLLPESKNQEWDTLETDLSQIPLPSGDRENEPLLKHHENNQRQQSIWQTILGLFSCCFVSKE